MKKENKIIYLTPFNQGFDSMNACTASVFHVAYTGIELTL